MFVWLCRYEIGGLELSTSIIQYGNCVTIVMSRITITIGGSSCDLSFNLDHTPTLPECGACEACEVLDVWLMIERCVKMRSKLLLQVFVIVIIHCYCNTLGAAGVVQEFTI